MHDFGEQVRETYRRQGEARAVERVLQIIESGKWSGDSLAEDVANLKLLILEPDVSAADQSHYYAGKTAGRMEREQEIIKLLSDTYGENCIRNIGPHDHAEAECWTYVETPLAEVIALIKGEQK